MKKKKKFDCVAMKNAIQAKHARRYAAMTDAERWAEVERKLATSDHPVAAKWRAIREAKPVAGSAQGVEPTT